MLCWIERVLMVAGPSCLLFLLFALKPSTDYRLHSFDLRSLSYSPFCFLESSFSSVLLLCVILGKKIPRILSIVLFRSVRDLRERAVSTCRTCARITSYHKVRRTLSCRTAWYIGWGCVASYTNDKNPFHEINKRVRQRFMIMCLMALAKT